MRLHRSSIVLALLAGAGCVANGGSPAGEPSSAAPDQATEPSGEPSADPAGDPAIGPAFAASVTPTDVAATCAVDPRVVVNAVSATTCIGANLFFRAPFGGNGRTCATCHRVNNNLTIDPKFIATLPKTDPLFVAEFDSVLEDLEKPPQMHEFSLILENVDGFAPDPTTHFVLRSVPHTLSLATSVTRPPGSPNPPADRTGWSGDGAPDAGALRDFMTGAIRQHYTKTLARDGGHGLPAGQRRPARSDRSLHAADRAQQRAGALGTW